MNNLNDSEPAQISRLIPLFLVIFIDSMGYFLVIPVILRLFIDGEYGLIPLNTSLTVRNVLYGITVTLAPLAFLISAPLIGSLSDQWGRKKTIFLCLLGSLTGFILPIIGILTRSLPLLLLGRFITGFSSSSQPVAQAAITDFTQKKQKAFYLAMIGFAMTLAMILGPLGGGYLSDPQLVSWFTVMTPYWAAVILSFINIVLLLAFYREKSEKQKKPTSISLHQSIKILFGMLTHSAIRHLLLIFLLMELAWSQYYQVIFLFLREYHHYTASQIALFTGYIGFWMSLGLTIIYRVIIRYVPIERILRVSMIMISVGFAGCTFLPGTSSQWVFVIFISLFVGMAYPSLLALISNHADKAHQGWVMGVASTLLGSAWMCTAFLSGWLINYFDRLPLLFATGCSMAGLFVLSSWKNESIKNRRQP